jgi:hypothetical protein
MELRVLSENLVLGPEELALLREAFDAAWAEVAPHYQDSPTSFEVARLRMANSVLAAHRHGTIGVAAIKAAAVQSFRSSHLGLSPAFWANGVDEGEGTHR